LRPSLAVKLPETQEYDVTLLGCWTGAYHSSRGGTRFSISWSNAISLRSKVLLYWQNELFCFTISCMFQLIIKTSLCQFC